MIKAVSNYEFPIEDRDEWFSLTENPDHVFGSGLPQLRNC